MILSPEFREKDWESIETKINRVKDFSKAIHIDIIDGKFAPNETFLNPEPFRNIFFLVFCLKCTFG